MNQEQIDSFMRYISVLTALEILDPMERLQVAFAMGLREWALVSTMPDRTVHVTKWYT